MRLAMDECIGDGQVLAGIVSWYIHHTHTHIHNDQEDIECPYISA